MSQLIGTTFLYVYGDTLELLFWNGWGYLGYGPQSCQQSLPLTCCRFMVRLSCCNTFPSVGVLMFGSSSFLFNLEFRDSFSCFLWRVQVLSENADTYLVTYEGVLALLWGHVEPGYGHMAPACICLNIVSAFVFRVAVVWYTIFLACSTRRCWQNLFKTQNPIDELSHKLI